MAASGVGKRVVIGGASGFVGRNLCRELTGKGYEVIALTQDAGKLENDIERTWSGVASWGDLNYVVSNCDAVVNLAGTPIIALGKRWTPEYRNSVVRSRIDTTRLLTDAIRNANKKPSVFVCASAVSYYPPSSTRDSKQFDESQVCKPYDFLSELCHQWEASANEAKRHSGVRTVSVRTGVALGRSGGMINNMFWPFFFGFGGPIGNGQQPLPWIHVHDLAGIYMQAIGDESIEGPINATAPADNSFGEFAREFGRAIWRPALLPLPEFVVRTIFGDERAVMFTKGQRVVPRKALDSHYEFIYPDLTAACKSVGRLSTSREDTG